MNLVQRMNPFFWLVILAIYSTPSMALSVELIETSPKSPVTLNQDEALYVLIRYKSDQPLRFQAIGENLQQKIMDSARFNPSQAYPAGEGEAIAWVAYDNTTEIDSITVTIYDANWRALQTKSIPVSAVWQNENNSNNQPVAPWVQRLNQQQQSSVFTNSQTSLSSGDAHFVQFLFLLIPLYWLLQIFILFNWTGRWKKLACFPLFFSIPLLLYTLYALYAGSNLWPLMMIFATPFILVFLLFIIGYKRIYSR
ncbi:TPA: hypothetical protein RG395_003301 [Legionella pneumophila]|nr:hypothetical protein [Legionella pneumophila]HAT3975733.1 hypothetical protein [Legionella pneumophila]HAT3977728.1 hypothetical protein [Legionella pneumophila]HBC0468374.1 hypothetical protein [Legionella pneumophila]HBC0469045.1 hypothetical protein [Legionella pneumophila]HBC2757190.1 hypothetical protein [Legionella pneumophila]